MRRREFLGIGAASGVLLSGTFFAGWWQVDGPGAPEPIDQRPLPLSAMEFQLIDHEGNAVDSNTLVGRATMVFFGFTYCPDVCPTTLSDIAGWLNAMGEDANDLNVVFITVDPDRDTVDVMAEYVSYFHPVVRGWTGAARDIAQAAEGFRATYEKVPTDNGEYTMNHTASVFLFDPVGSFVGTIDYHEPREFAVQKIRRAIGRSGERAI